MWVMYAATQMDRMCLKNREGGKLLFFFLVNKWLVSSACQSPFTSWWIITDFPARQEIILGLLLLNKTTCAWQVELISLNCPILLNILQFLIHFCVLNYLLLLCWRPLCLGHFVLYRVQNKFEVEASLKTVKVNHKRKFSFLCTVDSSPSSCILLIVFHNSWAHWLHCRPLSLCCNNIDLIETQANYSKMLVLDL